MSLLEPQYQDEFWEGEPVAYPSIGVVERQPVITLGNEFTVPELAGRLTMPNSLVLLPNMFQEVGAETSEVTEVQFELEPDWQKGRTDSAHQVFFGRLQLQSDKEREYPIAVKPFHIARDLAIHEMVAYDHVSAQTFIRSLSPLGFWVDSSRRTNLLTHFEEDVRSLDNIDWLKDADETLREHFYLFKGLQLSAFTLGKLHGRGYIHGDAQIKNMAVANDGVRLIDLENARLVYGGQGQDMTPLIDGVRADLGKLVTSVLKRGYLHAETPAERRDMINMALLGPHLGIIRHPSTPIRTPELHDAIEEIDQDILSQI